MKTSLMTLLLTFLFSGCSHKVIYEKEVVCIEQKTVTRPQANIRIIKDDFNVATAFKDSLDLVLEFYESQVNRNNTICEKVNNDTNTKN